MANAGVYLQNFSSEELSRELERRKDLKLFAWRDANINRNIRLSTDIVDFVAPFHSKTDLSDCNKTAELLSSGYSRCNRCSLEAMRISPGNFADVSIDITVDFTVSKQVSFK